MRRLMVRGSKVLALAASVAACGDSSGPVFRIDLEVEGRLERSAVVSVTASFQGETLPAAAVTLSADPAGSVEFLSAGQLRFLMPGELTLLGEAEVEGRVERGMENLEVALPPRIVLDLSFEGNRDIYRVALDGGELTRLTDAEGDDIDPSVAGGTVVFTSFRDGNANLYSVPLSGGAAQRLTATADDEIQPALSPAGDRIAYMTDPEGVFRLWWARANGDDPAPLTADWGSGGSVEASPAWAPVAAAIVFVSTTNGTADIFTVGPGNDPMPLVVSGDANVEPAWSFDGDHIVFASNRVGDTELFQMSLSTEEITRLTNRQGADGEPAWLPDGRLVYTAWTGETPALRWLDPESPAETFEIPLGGDSPRRASAAPN